jgi:hypothetical protein
MCARKTALWIGFIYMWALVLACYFLSERNPSGAAVFWLAVAGLLIVPFALSVSFAWKFGPEYRQAYFITGIPATLALLAQYILTSFIPFIVVPRGTMAHIMGPPHPFDVFGQLMVAFPIIGWAAVFPISGRICFEIAEEIANRLRWKTSVVKPK